MFDKAFCVSIHASSREDATILAFHFHCRTCFNPRVLAGGRDTRHIGARIESHRFNPRVLAGGRDFCISISCFWYLFQSTRPRGRTRQNNHDACRAEAVSIHASSREDATIVDGHTFYLDKFQSTRPRGRTRLGVYADSKHAFTFQSTRPRGRTRLALVQSRKLRRMFQSTRPRGRTRLSC